MSLNGLDSPDVREAYQTAVAEAAGWFLLQYVSRDGVELLARGRNGVSEARNAITAYTQASPLYGLMIYRRRRLLIKYIPEGTSRLLQARTTVHFQDILERYSPYETLLEITTGEALNDTALAKTFQLHTASPSPSAGRLDEITEDGEDAGADVGSLNGTSVSSSLSAAQRYKAARRADNSSKRAERGERPMTSLQVSGGNSPSMSPQMTPAVVTLNSGVVLEDAESPTKDASPQPDPGVETVASIVVTEPEQSASPPRTSDLLVSAAVRLADDAVQESAPESPPVEMGVLELAPEEASTLPSQTVHLRRGEDAEAPPSISSAPSEAPSSIRDASMDYDPYDLSKYDKYFQPKVKLGPRPVTSAEKVMRPARVSVVPASLRQSRKPEPLRPQSQGQVAPALKSAPLRAEPTMRLPLPPPIPVEYNPRPYSRGSVKSAPSHRSTAMTPDRLRLMKAVELRKRQIRKSQGPQSFTPPVEDPPEMPELPPPEPIATTSDEKPQHQDAEAEQSHTDDETHPQSIKADSGIEIRYGTPSSDDADERAASLRDNPNDEHPVEPGASDERHGSALSKSTVVTAGRDVAADSAEDKASMRDSHTPTERTAGLHEASDAASTTNQEMADRSRPATPDTGANLEVETLAHAPSSDTLRNAEPISRPASSDLTRRRRGLVEPLHIETPSGNPDDFMSDDEFLEELHSATVQEARPILFSHQPSMEDISMVRSVSITRNMTSRQSETGQLSPESSPALLSSSPPEKGDSAWNAPRKVSSGISRRIQALNEVSTREANASGFGVSSSPVLPGMTPNASLQRDAKGRGPRKAPSPGARPVSFRKSSKPSSASQAPIFTSPVEQNAPVWSVQHDPVTSRNSVSVTARIVRSRTEPDPAQLLQSDLTINGNRNPTSPLKTDLPPIDIDAAQQSTVSSPALSSSSRGSGDARNLHSSSSRFGRRAKLVASPETPQTFDFPAPPHQSASTPSVNDGHSTHKIGTRTSRFFKRVSTLSGPKRRQSQQSVMETASVRSLESGAGAKMSSRASLATHDSDTPPAVVVGDLNVQFPDSLLWKRRIVTINDNGHLQFAIAHAMEIHKGVAMKSFPLQLFNAPYAPDLDRQELANSVVLELQDGTTVQLACEDTMTQRQVLHLLKNYWKSWAVV